MNPEQEKNKKAILARLKRIEGQIRGIQSMVESDRDCTEVLQQLTAVRSAVHSTSVEVLESYASACMLDDGIDLPEGQRQKLLSNFMTLLGKTKVL
jgi:CsoR family transcriptional regulator, copper-sensing transcriptional repressor